VKVPKKLHPNLSMFQSENPYWELELKYNLPLKISRAAPLHRIISFEYNRIQNKRKENEKHLPRQFGYLYIFFVSSIFLRIYLGNRFSEFSMFLGESTTSNLNSVI
jgi:hypothetical protein